MSHLALPMGSSGLCASSNVPQGQPGPTCCGLGPHNRGVSSGVAGTPRKGESQKGRNTEPPGVPFLFQKYFLLPAQGFLVCIP